MATENFTKQQFKFSRIIHEMVTKTDYETMVHNETEMLFLMSELIPSQKVEFLKNLSETVQMNRKVIEYFAPIDNPQK